MKKAVLFSLVVCSVAILAIISHRNSTNQWSRNSPRPSHASSQPEADVETRHVSSNHERCGFLRKYNPKPKSRENCTILVERMRCENATNIGRTPLPNFFSERRNSGDTADGAYRKANVAYVHMPKAGGTSVEAVLSKMPGLKNGKKVRKFPVWHCAELHKEAMAFRNYKQQTLFFSKRTFGLHDFAYPGRPFAYLTWVREPIARVVSTYYYQKKMKCAGIHKVCAEYVLKSKNLTDYLHKTRDIHYPVMDNFYVRLLQFGDFPEVDVTFEDGAGAAELKDAKNIPPIEEKHYMVAKNNLWSKMAFVGLTEDFKTSQDMLSYVFGIPAQESEVHINANAHDNDLTDFELEELTRRNVWDIKLYEEAKKIYDHQKKIYLERKH